jgi:hypothetical protein
MAVAIGVVGMVLLVGIYGTGLWAGVRVARRLDIPGRSPGPTVLLWLLRFVLVLMICMVVVGISIPIFMLLSAVQDRFG